MTFTPRAIEAAAAHVLRELDDRGLLKGVDDDLFAEIGNDVAEAAITAALAGDGVALQGWQPIESAPRNGTIILIVKAGGEPYAAYWSQCERAFSAHVSDNEYPWVILDETNGVNALAADSPTHWQPLPQPPAASEREERNPTLQDRYTHLKSNAEAFVESMKVMVTAAEKSGDADLASKLRTWCLSPWEAALRDDTSGDLWFICESCGKPIKDDAEQVSSEDGCWFHRSCVAANDVEERK